MTQLRIRKKAPPAPSWGALAVPIVLLLALGLGATGALGAWGHGPQALVDTAGPLWEAARSWLRDDSPGPHKEVGDDAASPRRGEHL